MAGLVIHEAQTIPEPGQTFIFHGHRFQVLRRQRNQITALRVSPPLDETEKAVRPLLPLAVAAFLIAGSAQAAETLRDLCPDRPAKGTAPCTVDAGHLQLEMDAGGRDARPLGRRAQRDHPPLASPRGSSSA